jgi:hypothetical protein
MVLLAGLASRVTYVFNFELIATQLLVPDNTQNANLHLALLHLSFKFLGPKMMTPMRYVLLSLGILVRFELLRSCPFIDRSQ